MMWGQQKSHPVIMLQTDNTKQVIYDHPMISLPIWISGLLFALIHSVFAAEVCKKWFYQRGLTTQRYRLLYSIFALLLTVIWFFYIYQLPDKPLYHIHGWLNWLLIFIQLCGLWIVILSLKSFDTKVFLGISHPPEQGEGFHEHGIYRHMRHPMYSGVMLALLASPIQSLNSLNLTLAICFYFVMGSYFEERRMLQTHPAYDDYKKRIPAFVPWRTLFRGHSSS